MTPIKIIEKKRSGKILSRLEIESFVERFMSGVVPDYQMSALLMAVCFQGMNIDETVNLTRVMIESGGRVDFSDHPVKMVDKHSTGGVGDKLSLLVAPTVAACGGGVPMISGRGLGHTGGTLDKLESIPGFNVNLSPRELREQALKLGAAMVGQNNHLVPADRKIYALRDVTSTVKSLPLIASSIISKKAVEGIDALLLDVKVGDGAIFDRRDKMEELARLLVQVGEEFGLETTALLTNMDQPLGYAVGNWLEVAECLKIMKTGQGAKDLMELNSALSAAMLNLSGIARNLTEGISMAENALSEGITLDKFKAIVKAQGGNVEVLENPEKYPSAKYFIDITAVKNGFISNIRAKACGELSMLLGAGRVRMEDDIDYTAGIVFRKKTGDWILEGEPLARLYSNSEESLEKVAGDFPKIISISDNPPIEKPLIFKVVHAKGEQSWEEYRRS